MMASDEIWFKGRKLKKDYQPKRMEAVLTLEEQEVVKAFFHCLLVLRKDYSVSSIMTAYRKARMTNIYRGKRFLYADI